MGAPSYGGYESIVANGHPVTNPLYKPDHGIDVVSGWCADVDLRVVGIRVTCETAFCNDVEEFGRIQ